MSDDKIEELEEKIEHLQKCRTNAIKQLEASNAQLRLQFGEMTAQEMRTLRAGFSLIRTILD
jgi:signal-transduction protein with cAMP-binding, CBS, and nucleotidyltransferase domain